MFFAQKLKLNNKVLSFKTRDTFSEISTPDTQDAVLENPQQNIQKIWNWQKGIFPKKLSESFPLDTLNVVLPNLRKKFYRKLKEVQQTSQII